VEEWVHGTGIPSNMLVPRSPRFEAARTAAEDFARTGSLAGVRKDTWVTAEWLLFLEHLPPTVTAAQMARLDEAFRFTQAGNSEVLFAWLMHAVRSRYEPAFPALESFLTRQGRRKFLRPLYEDLVRTDWGTAMAKQIYAKARPLYHSVSTATLDPIVNQ
jgi:hypothetical protein